MDERCKFADLSQKALLMKRILSQHGVTIDILQARDILVKSNKVQSWESLQVCPALANESYKADMYVVLLYAIEMLTNIAFPTASGVSNCKLLTHGTNKFYGLEIENPWRKEVVKVTINNHTLEGAGYHLGFEILHGLAHRKSLEDFADDGLEERMPKW